MMIMSICPDKKKGHKIYKISTRHDVPSGTGLGCVISDKVSLSKKHIYIYMSYM